MILAVEGEKEFKTVGDLVDFLRGFDRTMSVRGSIEGMYDIPCPFPLGDWSFKVGTRDEKDILELIV